MRLGSKLGTAFVALLLVWAATSAAYAQGTIVVDPRTGQFYEQRGPAPAYRGRPDPRHQPPPQARPGQYYPGMPVPQQPGFSLRRLFGIPDQPPPQVVPRQRPERAARPARPRPPPAVAARPKKPKVDPSTHVVVFGDALADLVGQGLDDAFEETPDVAVVRKARSDGGLARDAAEWPKMIQDVLDGGQKITLAVMMLGTKDRQPIREGDVSHEPLTERWKELYEQRVDAVARIFKERGIPLIWVGLPPIKNTRVSADLIAMNEIYRESVQRAGGAYVDIWPGFVDDENRYTQTGPDVDGHTSRLRTNDGVLFTRAGSRKAAHFVDTEIKRILEAKRTGTPIAVVPPNGGVLPGGSPIDEVIDASLPALPEPSGTPPLQPKPVAGPVLPLTRQEVSPGGTLVSGRPRLDKDSTYILQKTLREGVTTNPRPGRADDFRWPRS